MENNTVKSIIKTTQKEIDEAYQSYEEIYNSWFSPYFSEAREMFSRLRDKDRPIADRELEWILTDLPMELFNVSESLSKLKLSKDVSKIRSKYLEEEYDVEAAKISAAIYDSLIIRVEKEISFCKELIMGAKKLWDARRSTENSMPVGEVVDSPEVGDLPDYM